MMFWNTKAFHAQTSAWFGVKERAGLPAKLFLALSLTLISPPPLLLSTASPTPSEELTVQAAAGAPSSLPQLLRHPPPTTTTTTYTHILQLCAVIPAVSIVQCLTREGGACVCVEGRSCSPQITAAQEWCKSKTLMLKLSHLLNFPIMSRSHSWLVVHSDLNSSLIYPGVRSQLV